MTDLDDAVRLTWRFDADPARVFAAFSDAEQYRRWAWGALGAETAATVDCRPGGSYRVETRRPDGATWAFLGEYLECAPDERLVYTVEWTAPMGYTCDRETVEVTFRPDGDGTALEFVHRGPPAEARAEHRAGWANTLETLANMLGGGAPA